MTSIQALAKTGTEERLIPVAISYRIIELFSAGLYSSPNKAIEELVANSYDAMAKNVHVILPPNPTLPDAFIWVIDDGLSMDADGFADLWKIANSTKRDPGRESKVRPPIGKFGIGKLATYVLARQLTYICKCKGQYRAVTMDYTQIDPSKEIVATTEHLPVRLLTEEEATTLLAPILSESNEASDVLPLFGSKASTTWTVAIMGNLTALAQKLTPGRLRWVLSTALPLSPHFNLFFSGNRLQSSKEKIKPLRTWEVGIDDRVAEKLSLVTASNRAAVEIDGVGEVHGRVEIFADSLTGGKSEDWGRSHGFFVMVRGRLINIDDALFGLNALSHGPFAHFRMEVHADGLDAVLRSTREAVLETEGVKALQKYLNDKFNEVRTWYANWLKEQEYEARISTRIGATPQSLSGRPILNAVRGLLDGAIEELTLTRMPPDLKEADKQPLLDHLEEHFKSELGLIRSSLINSISAES